VWVYCHVQIEALSIRGYVNKQVIKIIYYSLDFATTLLVCVYSFCLSLFC